MAARPAPGLWMILPCALLAAAGCVTAPPAADPEPQDPARLVARAREAFGESQRAEERGASAEARAAAERGLASADRARRLDPHLAAAHYAYALCLGALLDASAIPDLDRVPEMERAALEAARLDPALEDAAPHRFLARLYLEAPGWPVSVGDVDRAVEHAEEACRLAPADPENHIVLGRALLERDDEGDAARARAILERTAADPETPDALAREARAALSGE